LCSEKGENVKPATCNLKSVLALILSALLLSACAAPTATPTTKATATPLPLPTTPPSPTVPPGRVRPSAIAGSWYPGDPDELAAMVDEMLAAVQPVDGPPTGLIVPHAGYVYSGPVAACGFRQLEGGRYDVAVIIASDHQSPLSDPISVWAEGGFETPLGVVPVDVELAQALVSPPITASPPTSPPTRASTPSRSNCPFSSRSAPVAPSCRC
jgi:hypothetical protein